MDYWPWRPAALGKAGSGVRVSDPLSSGSKYPVKRARLPSSIKTGRKKSSKKALASVPFCARAQRDCQSRSRKSGQVSKNVPSARSWASNSHPSRSSNSRTVWVTTSAQHMKAVHAQASIAAQIRVIIRPWQQAASLDRSHPSRVRTSRRLSASWIGLACLLRLHPPDLSQLKSVLQ